LGTTKKFLQKYKTTGQGSLIGKRNIRGRKLATKISRQKEKTRWGGGTKRPVE